MHSADVICFNSFWNAFIVSETFMVLNSFKSYFLQILVNTIDFTSSLISYLLRKKQLNCFHIYDHYELHSIVYQKKGNFMTFSYIACNDLDYLVFSLPQNILLVNNGLIFGITKLKSLMKNIAIFIRCTIVDLIF